MQPPTICALAERFFAAALPIKRPVMQMANVTSAIVSEATAAMMAPYSAIVKPTLSASIEVAKPCNKSVPNDSGFRLLEGQAAQSRAWQSLHS